MLQHELALRLFLFFENNAIRKHGSHWTLNSVWPHALSWKPNQPGTSVVCRILSASLPREVGPTLGQAPDMSSEQM